jgi:hypothetical protein
MIGYHYTSAHNWEVIQREGLKPYLVESLSKVAAPFGVSNTGVWLYMERQRGLSHLGCIIWQAITKKTENVVLLEVTYDESWGLESGFGVTHDLDWKGFMFHRETPVQIIHHEIAPEAIRVLNHYDISTFADLYDQKDNPILA